MEETLPAFAKLLIDLGIAGLMLAVSLWLNYWLLTKWQESQTARIDEGKEAVRALGANEDALNRLSESIRASAE